MPIRSTRAHGLALDASAPPPAEYAPKSSSARRGLLKVVSLEAQGCKPEYCSLRLPEDLSRDNWLDIGRAIASVQTSVNWWFGDWWVFGEHAYGERSELVGSVEWDGPAFQTCANAARVCRAFETSRRREVLTFSHHEVVAGLPAAAADALLDWAAETIVTDGKPRSIIALREEKLRRSVTVLPPPQKNVIRARVTISRPDPPRQPIFAYVSPRAVTAIVPKQDGPAGKEDAAATGEVLAFVRRVGATRDISAHLRDRFAQVEHLLLDY